MSKKKKHRFPQANQAQPVSVDCSQTLLVHRYLRHDLILVLVLVIIFLAILFLVFYLDKSSDLINNFASNFLSFLVD